MKRTWTDDHPAGRRHENPSTDPQKRIKSILRTAGPVRLRKTLACLVVSLCLSVFAGLHDIAEAAGKTYTHIVVLSDLHLPGRNLEVKRQTVDRINGWNDVDMVAVLGDICQKYGDDQEFAFAKDFLAGIKKPLRPITGNHDYLYEEDLLHGGRTHAPADVRARKLQRFREAFSLKDVYYHMRLERYHLVFLSTDSLDSSHHVEMSGKQLEWFASVLRENRDLPTLVFYHAPLKGTITGNNILALFNSFFAAQPSEKIRAILKDNPQVFLWVSGHIHTAPSNLNYAHRTNLYEGQVVNIHNPDMDGRSFVSHAGIGAGFHDNVWTNSLFLYPDRVVVKTYDQKKGLWLEDKTREVRLPVTAPR